MLILKNGQKCIVHSLGDDKEYSGVVVGIVRDSYKKISNYMVALESEIDNSIIIKNNLSTIFLPQYKQVFVIPVVKVKNNS